MVKEDLELKKFPKLLTQGYIAYAEQVQTWCVDTVKARQKQIDDANKELMNIFSKGKAPFDRETHGRICKLQGRIKAKKEDLGSLKGE